MMHFGIDEEHFASGSRTSFRAGIGARQVHRTVKQSQYGAEALRRRTQAGQDGATIMKKGKTLFAHKFDHAGCR